MEAFLPIPIMGLKWLKMLVLFADVCGTDFVFGILVERQNIPALLSALEATEKKCSKTAEKQPPSQAECLAPPALDGQSPPNNRKAQKKSSRVEQNTSEAESLQTPQVRVGIGPAPHDPI